MNMMRHCRQCRADAVGLLGEDRGEEFTLDKIDSLDIDYAAAMENRAVVQADIEAERLRQKERQANLKEQLKSANGKTLFTVNGLTLEQNPAAASLMASKTLSNTPLPTGLRSVQMAVASSGQGLINQHFGSAKEFMIYEVSSKGARLIGHRKTAQYCTGPVHCGDGDAALPETIDMLKGCEVVLCSKVGFKPWDQLEAAGIIPNGEYADQPIVPALLAVYAEMHRSGALEVNPLSSHPKSA